MPACSRRVSAALAFACSSLRTIAANAAAAFSSARFAAMAAAVPSSPTARSDVPVWLAWDGTHVLFGAAAAAFKREVAPAAPPPLIGSICAGTGLGAIGSIAGTAESLVFEKSIDGGSRSASYCPSFSNDKNKSGAAPITFNIGIFSSVFSPV